MPLPRIRLHCAPARLLRGDPDWPIDLDQLRNPPEEFWTAGALPPLVRAVAIVGTRHADDAGIELAHSLAANLARSGCVIVSGGARGIDAAAHTGALESNASTVAVLATGLERAYPRENRSLFEQIVERGGALCSEVPGSATPHRGRFLQRNRLIAALCRIVVVVQAPARSGALSTARHAASLGRPVLAVPGSPMDPRSAGCLELLRKGARICTSAADALSVLVPSMPAVAPVVPWSLATAPPVHGLDGDGTVVWSALSVRPRHPDEICAKTRLPPARVQRALLTLLLGGLALEREGGYLRAPSRSRGKGL